MSKRKAPKRRPRVVDAEECPQCGAHRGEKCRNYKGRGCAPHASPDRDREAEARERIAREDEPTQGMLF